MKAYKRYGEAYKKAIESLKIGAATAPGPPAP